MVSPLFVLLFESSWVLKVRLASLPFHIVPKAEHDPFSAMHSLGIPTTRSLSLVSLPALPVLRERVESACVLTRVAPSFIRIGSFEALNPPEKMFFFGGGQQDAHWDSLRVLGEWVGQRVLKLQKIKWRDEANDEGDVWGRELVLEVARRNARMVAGWQAYGFMHGVINTDKYVRSPSHRVLRIYTPQCVYHGPHYRLW